MIIALPTTTLHTDLHSKDLNLYSNLNTKEGGAILFERMRSVAIHY